MNYFSIRISILCLVDELEIPADGYTRDIQVHIVKADSLESAFKRALEIGKSEETAYVNNAGNKVKWVFESIESITCLGESLEGKEVSSRMEGYYPDKPIPFEFGFHPEKYEPKD